MEKNNKIRIVRTFDRHSQTMMMFFGKKHLALKIQLTKGCETAIATVFFNIPKAAKVEEEDALVVYSKYCSKDYLHYNPSEAYELYKTIKQEWWDANPKLKKVMWNYHKDKAAKYYNSELIDW